MTTDAPGQSAQLFLRVVRMIGIDDFIAMKIFAGGPRDIEDVRGVLKVSRELVNLDLAKQLTARYGPREHTLLETLLAES